MACYNNCYLPRPPRAWSRVQNSCSVNEPNINPYTGQLVFGDKIAMLNKGNILQYKANSSNLTKTQKYSKIAKGQWVNRNTTWANQSTRGYTNPNTTGLKRTGNVTNIAIDPITGAIIGPTTDPITCPQPVTYINEALPASGGGGSSVDEPEIPPPIEPTPASETFPSTIPDTATEPIVIQDGGVLICSVQENPCTGETKSTLSQQLCNPTTASDVPGTIQELCWNDGTQTWYPRSRYVMTNSANKWPTNAILFSSVRPSPPIITSITSNNNIVTLSWTQDEFCLPVSFFNIFQDGILVKTVSGLIFTADIVVDNCNTYEYFIIAVTNGTNILSEPSNTVSINISYILSPINLSFIVLDLDSIQLIWQPPIEYCGNNIIYEIYENITLIGTTTNTNFTVNGLTNCTNYSFSVVAIDSEQNISSPTVLNMFFSVIFPPTNLAYTTTASNTINLTWNAGSACTPIQYRIFQGQTVVGTTSNTNFTVTGLTNCDSYTFSVLAFDNFGNQSTSVTINNIIPLWPNPPTNLAYTTTASNTIQLTWSVPSPNCAPPVNYQIYQGAVLIGNTSNTNFTVTGLTNCDSYTFSVYSEDTNGNISLPATINNVIPLWPNPPINLTEGAKILQSITGLNTGTATIQIFWSQPTTICYIIDGYDIYINSSKVATVIGTTYTTNPLPINANYNFYIKTLATIYSPGPIQVESIPSSTLIVNLPVIYTITGTPTQNYSSGQTTLEYTTNGTLIFNYNYNINVIAVGAGGGAGGGSNNQGGNPTESAGGGGGGGGIGILNNKNISSGQLFNISVGNGGNGGLGNNNGSIGGDSSFKDSVPTNYLTASGGTYGGGHFGGSAGGVGGNASSIFTITTYNGANGGQGYQTSPSNVATNGSNIIPAMPITLPNSTNYYFSGGGGGGVYTSTFRGGLAGNNGNGGTAGGNSTSTGQTASPTSYGSGGGGGGCPSTSSTATTGGDGSNGIVIIYF